MAWREQTPARVGWKGRGRCRVDSADRNAMRRDLRFCVAPSSVLIKTTGKMLSMISGNPTAETDMTVQLPEGNYAAHAVMGIFPLSPVRQEPIVEITMREGHKIPVGGSDKHITGYTALVPTFDKALEELIYQVRTRRQRNGFTAPPFASSVEPKIPQPNAKGWTMVRLRRLDGTTALVPAGTKAIPLQQVDSTSPPSDERIPMTDKLRSAFEVLALPIEKYVGHLVAYEPSPGATELHEAVVEDEQGASDATSRGPWSGVR